MKSSRKPSVLILLLLCILFSNVGCNQLHGYILSDEQLLISQWEKDMRDDNGDIEFTAVTFAQDVTLSWMYSLDVKVYDGDIYLNDILYDSVEHITDPKIVYSQGFVWDMEMNNGNNATTDALKKIKNSDSCYMLKTENISKYGQQIVVYNIDGTYFFLSFFENSEVARIHFAKK